MKIEIRIVKDLNASLILESGKKVIEKTSLTAEEQAIVNDYVNTFHKIFRIVRKNEGDEVKEEQIQVFNQFSYYITGKLPGNLTINIKSSGQLNLSGGKTIIERAMNSSQLAVASKFITLIQQIHNA